MRIAVLEDDPDQQDFIASCLAFDHHDITMMSRAAELFRHLQMTPFDLLILDWYLPDASGLEVMEHLRKGQAWQQPILFITAHRQAGTVVKALKSGADDFLAKPLEPAELRARVKALGKRLSSPFESEALTLGVYHLSRVRHEVTVKGKQIHLTDKEYQLTNLFFSHPGQLVSRNLLLELIWGLHGDVPTRTLDTHVSRLRRKLGLDGLHGLRLRSVYQYGYRLEEMASTA